MKPLSLLLLILLSACAAPLVPKEVIISSKQKVDEDLTQYTVEQAGFIPWSDSFQPFYLQSSMIIPGYKPPIMVASLYSDRDQIWADSNGVMASFTNQRVISDTPVLGRPFDDSLIVVNIAGMEDPYADIDTIKVHREDVNGTTLWATILPVVGTYDKLGAVIIRDNGYIYLHILDELIKDTASLWRIDPESGAAKKLLGFDTLDMIWINDSTLYFISEEAGRGVIKARDLRDGSESVVDYFMDQTDDPDFQLVTPRWQGGLLFATYDAMFMTSPAGEIVARYTREDLLPAALRELPVPARIDATYALMQPDGTLVYPAVTDDGVYLLRLRWQ